LAIGAGTDPNYECMFDEVDQFLRDNRTLNIVYEDKAFFINNDPNATLNLYKGTNSLPYEGTYNRQGKYTLRQSIALMRLNDKNISYDPTKRGRIISKLKPVPSDGCD
jgi:hypothetical protein